MNALILVDLQNDFLPGGALAVPEGDQVLGIANARMSDHPLVVATRDWHPPDHRSFASQHPGKDVGETIELDGLQQILWPDHCVQGSRGAEFPAELNLDGVDHVVRKGMDRNVDSYSAFFDNAHRRATGLEDYLRSQNVDSVTILGLATDYCVKFTALDAVELGFRATVDLRGCRGVDMNPGDVDRAIQAMKDAGATLIRR